jgi:hypothetical protein
MGRIGSEVYQISGPMALAMLYSAVAWLAGSVDSFALARKRKDE